MKRKNYKWEWTPSCHRFPALQNLIWIGGIESYHEMLEFLTFNKEIHSQMVFTIQNHDHIFHSHEERINYVHGFTDAMNAFDEVY